MKIQKYVSRLRNDFRAVYECEHCGTTVEDYGYEDNHFHVHVIPAKHCASCSKNRAGDIDLLEALRLSLEKAK